MRLQSPAELVLRTATPFNYCVIDEVDSILIDEARTPLIISGTSDKPSGKYYKAAKIADALTKVRHFDTGLYLGTAETPAIMFLLRCHLFMGCHVVTYQLWFHKRECRPCGQWCWVLWNRH